MMYVQQYKCFKKIFISVRKESMGHFQVISFLLCHQKLLRAIQNWISAVVERIILLNQKLLGFVQSHFLILNKYMDSQKGFKKIFSSSYNFLKVRRETVAGRVAQIFQKLRIVKYMLLS